MVETKSFTKAAEKCSVPPSSLSRRIADLESSLGASLLVRSTRTVNVTEVGLEYYKRAAQIMTDLDNCNAMVTSHRSKPIGYLRISAQPVFGEQILLPLLDEFCELYPDITLDLHLSDELSALPRDEIDIAIRGGYAPNERVVAIRLTSNEFFAAASKAYLSRMGTPKHAMELKKHLGVFYRAPKEPIPWLCNIEGKWVDVSAPAVAICNNATWLVNKVVKGQGIMFMPLWFLQPYLDRGELEILDIKPKLYATPDTGTEFANYLLYQEQRYHLPKVKVAVEFLTEKIKGKY